MEDVSWSQDRFDEVATTLTPKITNAGGFGKTWGKFRVKQTGHSQVSNEKGPLFGVYRG